MDYFLGIGLFMFLSMVFAHFRKRTGWALASRDYPEFARKMGLHLREPQRGAIGKLRGVYDGYQVVVDPDDLCRISLRFVTEPLVELRSYSHFKRPPEGLTAFRSGDADFDAYFKERYAGEEIAEALSRTAGLGQLIRPFLGTRAVQSLAISPNGVECFFDYGRPPYIPVRTLEAFLPALTALAKQFEPPDSSTPRA